MSMPPEEGDVAHLWDMLEAARTVCELARGYTPEQYLSDRRTQLAVERAIEIIGEAARGFASALLHHYGGRDRSRPRGDCAVGTNRVGRYTSTRSRRRLICWMSPASRSTRDDRLA